MWRSGTKLKQLEEEPHSRDFKFSKSLMLLYAVLILLLLYIHSNQVYYLPVLFCLLYR